MNIRQLARARKGLLAAHIAFEAELTRLCVRRYYDADGDFDYDDEFDDGLACTRCGGEGFGQVDDPLWDDCDEFGYGECSACDGTGERCHQTVF